MGLQKSFLKPFKEVKQKQMIKKGERPTLEEAKPARGTPACIPKLTM
jgi:hypothetical protein